MEQRQTPQPDKDFPLVRGYFVPVDGDPRKAGGPSFVEIFAILKQSWKWAVAGLLFGGVLAGTYAFLAKEVFRSSVLISVSPPDDANGLGSVAGKLSGLAGIAGLNLGQADRTEEFLALLRSKELTQLFIRERELAPVLFYKQWDASRKRWRADDPDDIPTDEDVYRFFDEKVRSVQTDRRTGLVTVSIDWIDRTAAADWANAYISRANDFVRSRAATEARNSLKFLQNELEKTQPVELRQALFQLVETQKKHEMLASVRHEYAFHVIDRATVSDADHFEKPKRPLVIAAGALIGLLVGVGLGIRRALVRPAPPAY